MHVLYCFSLIQTNLITEDIYAWYFFANVRKKNKQHMLLIWISINKHKKSNYSYLQFYLPSLSATHFFLWVKRENTNSQCIFYDWMVKKKGSKSFGIDSLPSIVKIGEIQHFSISFPFDFNRTTAPWST